MKPCTCGSGKDSWELNDARGIYCGRACEDCEEDKIAQYRPDVFTDPGYWADEPIDAED